MKCLFVYYSIGETICFSHAVAILSSIARSENYEVDLAIITHNDVKKSKSIVLSKKPDIIAFSLPSLYWRIGQELARELKKNSPNTQLWVGGSHINARPEDFFQSPFDAACYGDGEFVFASALREYKRGGLFINKSWLTKQRYSEYKANIINDLDLSPLPDYKIFTKPHILEYPSLYFSKGCIFSCNYCMSRNGGYANRVRWKSTSRAIEECKRMVQYCYPSALFFDDDTFTKDIEWVSEFLDKYKKEVRVPFYCNSRPELINDKTCGLLSDSFCKGIGIGIETGSEQLRMKVLGRNTKNEQIIKAFKLCSEFNFETWSFNMINIPTETYQNLLETIKLNEIVRPTYVRISIFTPLPGTPLFKDVEEYYSYFESDVTKIIESKKKREIINSWISDLKNNNRLWND